MRMVSAALPVLTVAMALLVPAAAAQAPPEASSSLEITEETPDTIELAPGANTTLSLPFELSIHGTSCPTGPFIDVTAIADASEGLDLVASPAATTFQLGPGAYAEASPYTASATVEFGIQLPSTSSASGAYEAQLGFTFGGVDAPDCAPSVPPADATVNVTVTPTSADEGPIVASDDPDDGEDDNGVPGPGSLWVVAALSLAAARVARG